MNIIRIAIRLVIVPYMILHVAMRAFGIMLFCLILGLFEKIKGLLLHQLR